MKDQIMVQKTRIWSFKIRVGMDVSSVARSFRLFLPSGQDLHRLGCPLDMLKALSRRFQPSNPGIQRC